MKERIKLKVDIYVEVEEGNYTEDTLYMFIDTCEYNFTSTMEEVKVIDTEIVESYVV